MELIQKTSPYLAKDDQDGGVGGGSVGGGGGGEGVSSLGDGLVITSVPHTQ